MRLTRQGMERVRILLNLIKKREELKRDQIANLSDIVLQQLESKEQIPGRLNAYADDEEVVSKKCRDSLASVRKLAWNSFVRLDTLSMRFE